MRQRITLPGGLDVRQQAPIARYYLWSALEKCRSGDGSWPTDRDGGSDVRSLRMS